MRRPHPRRPHPCRAVEQRRRCPDRARGPHDARPRRLLALVLVLLAGLVALAGCTEPTEDLTERVERRLRDEAGLVVDATCTAGDGGELTGTTGESFACEVTSPSLDGELHLTGAVGPDDGPATIRVVEGTGTLGERAGFGAGSEGLFLEL